jgi:hypothetical protein
MNIPETNTACQNQSAHQKRYTRSIIFTMTAYVLTLFASIWYLKHFGQSLHWSIQSLIALVPVVPIAYFCKAYIVFLNESDELMRRIELEAVSLSSLIVGLLFMGLGFLGRSNIIELDGVTVAVWVFPLLCLFYGLGRWFANRRYQ